MSMRVGFLGSAGDGRRQAHLFHLRKVGAGVGLEVVVGWHRYSRGELEPLRRANSSMRLWAVGFISFAPDVSPALCEAVFPSIRVIGRLRNLPRPVKVPAAL